MPGGRAGAVRATRGAAMKIRVLAPTAELASMVAECLQPRSDVESDDSDVVREDQVTAEAAPIMDFTLQHAPSEDTARILQRIHPLKPAMYAGSTDGIA